MNDSMFSVMDIWGACRYSLYTAIGSTAAQLVDGGTAGLYSTLIFPGSRTNKRPYAVDRSHFILDDVISLQPDGSIALNRDNAISIQRVLSQLYGAQYRSAEEPLRDWCYAALQNIDEAGVKDSRELVIPVPDRLSADAQNLIINAARTGLGRKCTLLWRSVAAFLGNEKKLPSNLRVGEKVAVVDIESTGMTISYLWIDECDGNRIPAHRLFLDTDTGKRKGENYPYDKTVSSFSLGLEFPFSISDGMIVPAGPPFKTKRNPLEYLNSVSRVCKAIIVVGDVSEEEAQCISRIFQNSAIFDRTGESISYGAACFANRKSNGITAYYDECEALSLVVATRDEEYVFKALIKESCKLRSGLQITGEEVDGVFLRADNITADFYLRLGKPDRSAHLKSLSQPYSVPDELKRELHGKSLELVLRPSLVAGQGRATVQISPKDRRYNAVIPPVFLDWERMQEAFKDGRFITVEYLEENMERSFPPDIPYARTKGHIPWAINNAIKHFVLDQRAYSFKEQLNSPTYPNQDKRDVTKFEKLNTFGVPVPNDDGLPGFSQADKDLYKAFLRKIDAKFNPANPDDLIKAAAWTYHPDQLPHAMDYMRKRLGSMRSVKSFSISAAEASFIANMFQSESDARIFMEAFFGKLDEWKHGNSITSANHWYRATYQVLMVNASVLDWMAADNTKLYFVLGALISTYYTNGAEGKFQVTSNICKVICFLLKVRRKNNSFCKMDENDDFSIDGCFYSLLDFMTSNTLVSRNRFVASYLVLLSHNGELGFDHAKRAFEIAYQCLTGDDSRHMENVFRMLEYGADETRELIKSRNMRFYNKTRVWCDILNLYLNGKGNLSIPISDLNSD